MSDSLDADSLDAEWLDVEAVNEVLRDGNRWSHGRLISIDAERVGAEFGFSGRVYRLHLGAESDGPSSLVAKYDDAEGIARAVAFRGDNELLLAGRGLILLEDVHPATQGNDVTGCTEAQAGTIIDLIAMLHANTWLSGHDRPPDAPAVWSERRWEQDRWRTETPIRTTLSGVQMVDW